MRKLVPLGAKGAEERQFGYVAVQLLKPPVVDKAPQAFMSSWSVTLQELLCLIMPQARSSTSVVSRPAPTQSESAPPTQPRLHNLYKELLGHATPAIMLGAYPLVLPGKGDQVARAMQSALLPVDDALT